MDTFRITPGEQAEMFPPEKSELLYRLKDGYVTYGQVKILAYVFWSNVAISIGHSIMTLCPLRGFVKDP